jgi:O-methyltransferase involved in polyketide biosynthesis
VALAQRDSEIEDKPLVIFTNRASCSGSLRPGADSTPLATSTAQGWIAATRAATFDLLTTRFLADHPDAVVLQVGCGMDSRAFRVNPPASVQWFDVDFSVDFIWKKIPDVIAHLK